MVDLQQQEIHLGLLKNNKRLSKVTNFNTYIDIDLSNLQ